MPALDWSVCTDTIAQTVVAVVLVVELLVNALALAAGAMIADAV